MQFLSDKTSFLLTISGIHNPLQWHILNALYR